MSCKRSQGEDDGERSWTSAFCVPGTHTHTERGARKGRLVSDRERKPLAFLVHAVTEGVGVGVGRREGGEVTVSIKFHPEPIIIGRFGSAQFQFPRPGVVQVSVEL